MPDRGQQTLYCESFPGFGLRVSFGGTKSFVYVYRQYGQKRRTLLGHYPALTLAQAREKASRLRARIALNEKEPNRTTFFEALELYRATHLKTMRARVRVEQDRILTKYWQAHHDQRLSSLDKSAIAKVLDGMSDTPIMARNARSALRTFMNWAHGRDYCHPFPRINFKAKTSERDRTLDDDELRAIWNACSDESFGSIVRLLMLTGQRRGEIAALQSAWIADDVATITFPAGITKNGLEHTIPLTTAARSLLQSASAIGQCPTIQTQQRPSAHASSASRLLFPSHKTGAVITGWARQKAALDKKCGVTDWTLHDLRRTFSTKSADLGTQPHIVERCLNHQTGTLSPLARRYNRHKYWSEMVTAFSIYDEYISSLIAPVDQLI